MQPEYMARSTQAFTQRVPLGFLSSPSQAESKYSNFHQLQAKDIDGNDVNFADLNGKVCIHLPDAICPHAIGFAFVFCKLCFMLLDGHFMLRICNSIISAIQI